MGTKERLEMAEALLAKARSTPFRAERTTFAAGAHEQLSRYLASAGEGPAPQLDRPGAAPVEPLCIDLRDPTAGVGAAAAESAAAQYRAGPAAEPGPVGARVDIAI